MGGGLLTRAEVALAIGISTSKLSSQSCPLLDILFPRGHSRLELTQSLILPRKRLGGFITRDGEGRGGVQDKANRIFAGVSARGDSLRMCQMGEWVSAVGGSFRPFFYGHTRREER